jgi:hypothetical protein
MPLQESEETKGTSAGMRRINCCVWILVAGLCTGCGGTGPEMESRSVVGVEGKVHINGRLERGVHVSFFPDDPTQEAIPHGITDATGMYRLETYRQEGAPPGEYAVSIYWPAPPDPREADDSASPPDRLGRKYADPKTSGLRAIVDDSSTTVPTFELKSR